MSPRRCGRRPCLSRRACCCRAANSRCVKYHQYRLEPQWLETHVRNILYSAIVTPGELHQFTIARSDRDALHSCNPVTGSCNGELNGNFMPPFARLSSTRLSPLRDPNDKNAAKPALLAGKAPRTFRITILCVLKGPHRPL